MGTGGIETEHHIVNLTPLYEPPILKLTLPAFLLNIQEFSFLSLMQICTKFGVIAPNVAPDVDN